MLEKYSGISLTRRAFITPNALPFPVNGSCREPLQPSQIIWIQSDIAALTTSRETIVSALEEFSRKYQLPIVLIGNNVLERPAFTHQKLMGSMDFTSHLQFLQFASTSIGVAPLETVADEETLDFVSGKSDIKILLFTGHGHPGVYSNSPPYSESPLRECGQIIANSQIEWTEALEFQYREGWRNILQHQKRVRDERHIDRVARESWAPALQACALPTPMQGRELYDMFQSYHTTGASTQCALGQRIELTRNARALADSQQQAERLQAEVNDLRGSLSWKVTSPLRVLSKPFLQRRRKPEPTS
jgi:hypothetical protein